MSTYAEAVFDTDLTKPLVYWIELGAAVSF